MLNKQFHSNILEIQFYLDEHGVTPEQLQLLHGLGVQRDNRVVIVHSLLNNQPVGSLLLLQDSCAEVLLVAVPAGARMPKDQGSAVWTLRGI